MSDTIKPVAWLKDTSVIALQRDETTVLAYPHDYLIRPAVPLYTAAALDAAREQGRQEAQRAADLAVLAEVRKAVPEELDLRGWEAMGWNACCAEMLRRLDEMQATNQATMARKE